MKEKEENRQKDYTVMMNTADQWHKKGIQIWPRRIFGSQLTCPCTALGMRSLFDLQLFSSSLFLPFQCLLVFHFFSWPPKHCKLCIGNIWLWLFYFITKLRVSMSLYLAQLFIFIEWKQTRFVNTILASLFKDMNQREAIQRTAPLGPIYISWLTTASYKTPLFPILQYFLHQSAISLCTLLLQAVWTVPQNTHTQLTGSEVSLLASLPVTEVLQNLVAIYTGVSSTNLAVHFCFMPYFLRTGQTAELAYSALTLKNYWKTLLCSRNYPTITMQTYPKTNSAEMSWALDTWCKCRDRAPDWHPRVWISFLIPFPIYSNLRTTLRLRNRALRLKTTVVFSNWSCWVYKEHFSFH